MSVKLTIEPVEAIPDSARVRHYDELEYDAKGYLPTVVERGEGVVDAEMADQFHDGEFVKYTDYYRISLA